jgi:hypothetical protein
MVFGQLALFIFESFGDEVSVLTAVSGKYC